MFRGVRTTSSSIGKASTGFSKQKGFNGNDSKISPDCSGGGEHQSNLIVMQAFDFQSKKAYTKVTEKAQLVAHGALEQEAQMFAM